MTSRAWYLVSLGLVASAVTMIIVSLTQMMSRIEGMQRVAMPGEALLTLPAGKSTLYSESSSIVNGRVYEVHGSVQFRCELADEQGATATLRPAPASLQYQVPGYAGRSTFEAEVAAPGSYKLTCDGSDAFVIAIGHGVGAWLVVAIIGTVPIVAGFVIAIVIFVKRRGQKRRITAPSMTAT